MDFTKSKETTGGYSVRCLAPNGPIISGQWQDPESCKWNREVWDAKTGVLIKGDKFSPGFYDLIAPE